MDSLHSSHENNVDNQLPEQSTDQQNDMTPLQKHVAFFDRNKDGKVYPWETYKGFRAVGFGFIKSLTVGVLVNVAMSYSTLPGWMPSLLFPIYVKNIHKAKHGSDSGVYDHEGRFDPAKFESIFKKYACAQPDRLSKAEIDSMVKANRDANDLFGRIAGKVEWGLLYDLAKDDEGFLKKEVIRGVYDGTLFEFLEKQRGPTKQR